MSQASMENKSENASDLMENFQDLSELRGNGFNVGVWCEEEQKRYIVFVDFFQREFKSKHLRRFNKIFKTMSILIKSRDAIQCRSHHMKQLKTFKNVKNIIKNYRKKIGDGEYKILYHGLTSDSQIFREDQLTEGRKLKLLPEKVEVGVQANLDKPLQQEQTYYGMNGWNSLGTLLQMGNMNYLTPTNFQLFQPYQMI